uniref:DUF7769 domain-containing protein n=1 Tax=Spongospora subterranea TaxID=70186 RepID=A0A0H5QP04_9EUKA|eukprot:CRZ03327.1 hypothetical protein [Spongospora subterranea]
MEDNGNLDNRRIGSKGKELTPEQRRNVYEFMLERTVDGNLRYGAMKAAATEFLITRKVVSNIWSQGRKSKENGSIATDFTSRKIGKVGRKRNAIGLAEIQAIPLRLQCNIRWMAHALNIGWPLCMVVSRRGL